MNSAGLVAKHIQDVRYYWQERGVEIPASEIRGRSRHFLTSRARAQVARRLYETGLMTLADIGRALGRRHHTTIMYLVKKETA